jgi:hypothetical protein
MCQWAGASRGECQTDGRGGTDTRLTRAIRLYKGMGYAPIPLFGEYVSSPNTSLCFGKSLP